MNGRTVAVALACVSLALTAPARAAAPSPVKSCGSAPHQPVTKGWTMLPDPPFAKQIWPSAVPAAAGDGFGFRGSPRGAEMITPDPAKPGHVYTSDTFSLLESFDGGCTWKARWSLVDSTDPQVATSQIADIVVGNAGTKTIVYLALGPDHGGMRQSGGVLLVASSFVGGPLTLLRSEDGGTTFSRADTGLPPAPVAPRQSIAPRISVAPSDANVLYVNLNYGGGLWGSDDGGKTWSLRHPYTYAQWSSWASLVPPDAPVEDNVDFVCCDVDPLNPKEVWASTASRVVHSTDGGKTFTTAFPTKDPIWFHALGLSHDRGKPATVVFERSKEATLWGSTDGGAHFGAVGGGGPMSWPFEGCTAVCAARDMYAFTGSGTVNDMNQRPTRLVRLRASAVGPDDLSGAWYDRVLAVGSVRWGKTLTVWVVEQSYKGTFPHNIERRTFTL